MSFLYGKRFVGAMTSVVLDLRKELYNVPYDVIDWDKARNGCAKVSIIFTSPFLLTVSSAFYLR
jgi:cycloartenol synthase